jgi:hypothetical protein
MNVNKWVKKQIAALSIAFSNVEKNVLNQEGKQLDDNTKQEKRHLQGTLADSLVHGEITQEVKNLRWRNYKILKASKGTELEIDYVDEHGNVYYKTKKRGSKTGLNKVKVDTYDDYELEMVINNEGITNSVLDTVNDYVKDGVISAEEYFATNKTDKPLNIVREFAPKFLIENYTKKINIRSITNNQKLLEFYVSKYPDIYNKNQKLFLKEIKKVIDFGPRNISFLEINEINFITNNTLGSDDFLFYTYDNIIFDKIVEFDGYYVIKFKSDVVIDGEDILLEYIETDLDKKYENKESKIKRPKDFNQ